MTACSYSSDDLTGQRWATSVSRRIAQTIARPSLRLHPRAWRFVDRIYASNVTHNSRGFYSTHRPTTRGQYTAHGIVTASVGMLAHDESRVEQHSGEAVCLHARYSWPITNGPNALGLAAVFDITLAAWRAGLKPRPVHLPAHE